VVKEFHNYEGLIDQVSAMNFIILACMPDPLK